MGILIIDKQRVTGPRLGPLVLSLSVSLCLSLSLPLSRSLPEPEPERACVGRWGELPGEERVVMIGSHLASS